jgi:hypothetical protein
MTALSSDATADASQASCVAPCHEPDALVVATIRRWVADDFAAPARTRGLALRHSYGLTFRT